MTGSPHLLDLRTARRNHLHGLNVQPRLVGVRVLAHLFSRCQSSWCLTCRWRGSGSGRRRPCRRACRSGGVRHPAVIHRAVPARTAGDLDLVSDVLVEVGAAVRAHDIAAAFAAVVPVWWSFRRSVVVVPVVAGRRGCARSSDCRRLALVSVNLPSAALAETSGDR